MITAQQLIELATKAIRANFTYRNSRNVSGRSHYHERLVAQRRNQIREWVVVLRIARNPANVSRIEEVTHARPLMAHDLRRRVLSLVREPERKLV